MRTHFGDEDIGRAEVPPLTEGSDRKASEAKATEDNEPGVANASEIIYSDIEDGAGTCDQGHADHSEDSIPAAQPSPPSPGSMSDEFVIVFSGRR